MTRPVSGDILGPDDGYLEQQRCSNWPASAKQRTKGFRECSNPVSSTIGSLSLVDGSDNHMQQRPPWKLLNHARAGGDTAQRILVVYELTYTLQSRNRTLSTPNLYTHRGVLEGTEFNIANRARPYRNGERRHGGGGGYQPQSGGGGNNGNGNGNGNGSKKKKDRNQNSGNGGNNLPGWVRHLTTGQWLGLIRELYMNGSFNEDQLRDLSRALASAAAVALNTTWAKREQLGHSESQIVQYLNLPDATRLTLKTVSDKLDHGVYGPDVDGDISMFDATNGTFLNPNHNNSQDPVRDVYDFLFGEVMGRRYPGFQQQTGN